jgi:tetratricopeptide (TPR) repeat protein
LIYSNTLSAPFEFDDRRSIVQNPVIQDIPALTDIAGLDTLNIDLEVKNFLKTRYIGYLSFALNYNMHGLHVEGYHIVNILIHIINALLVYWIVILTFKSDYISRHSDTIGNPHIMALLSSLLFVCHPIQTQAVTYIVQRFASLATLFYLLALISYIRSRLYVSLRMRCIYYVIALGSTVAAMFTKEISFTLPIMIVIYEVYFFRGVALKRILYLLPFICTLMLIPLTLLGDTNSSNHIDTISNKLDIANLKSISSIDYLFTQFRVIVTYLRLLILPINQNLDYDYPIYNSFLTPDVYLSFLFLAFILCLGIFLFYRSRAASSSAPYIRLVSFGIIWFFITLSVESSIIPISDVIFEHRLYLPSVGFFICMVSALMFFRGKLKAMQYGIYRAIVPFLLLTIVVLAITTYERNYVWSDEIRLWQDTVNKSPNKMRPHYSLAMAYSNHNLLDASIKELLIVLDKKDIGMAHYSLGVAYFRQGLYTKSIDEYKKAIIKNPAYAEAYENLGVAYAMSRRNTEAVQSLQKAVQLNPSSVNARQNLGLAYESNGKIEDAVREYSFVILKKPLFINELNNLGVTLFKQGDHAAAIRKYQLVIKLKPDLVQAHYNLALSLIKLNNLKEAERELKIALSLKPDIANAHYNLALIYQKKNKTNTAISELKYALIIKPDYSDAKLLLDKLTTKQINLRR